MVVQKRERNKIHYDNVHGYIRCIEPLGRILLRFDSPGISTEMCRGDKSCRRGAVERGGRRVPKNNWRVGVDQTHQD